MLLTDQERDRFAAYAKQEAETNKVLAEQAEKISTFLAKDLKIKALAWHVVANDLARPVETVEV